MNIRNQMGQRAKNLETVSSYNSPNEFPMEAKNNQLYIDRFRSTLLIPMKNKEGELQLIPFHIQTVKNASLSNENNMTFLRINFHVPGQGACSKDVNFPILKHKGGLYVKEITLKSYVSSNLQNVFKLLKDQLKKIKMEDQINAKNSEIREED